MNALKIPAIVPIVAGILGLAYVSFNVPLQKCEGESMDGGKTVVSTKRATAPTRGSSTAILRRSNQATIISWPT